MGEVSLSEIWTRLTTLFVDPASNLTGALLLYAIITAALLVILILAIMFLISLPEDEEEGSESATTEEGVPAVAAGAGRPRQSRPPKPPVDPRTRLVRWGVALIVVVVVWAALGFTTSNSAVCGGCHVMTSHAAAEEGTDPHVDVACVSCHEPGGLFARYLGEVPSRVVHFVGEVVPAVKADEYGLVTGSGCEACHRGQMTGVLTNSETGVRMSHAEPLDAGATCLDCHKIKAGVVSARTVGMNPCMRCHDAKTASSECDTCHDKSASAAARARTTDLAKTQIATVSCGGCHNEKRDCDTCHGMRMPHSQRFMAGAHARAAAVDAWYNNGRTCRKCHTADRRPCQKCHTKFIGKAHPVSMARTHQPVTSSVACNSCHQQWAPTRSRDFCEDVCHSQAAIEESPR